MVSGLQRPAQPHRVLVLRAIPSPTKCRESLLLPSQELEVNFTAKALKHVRQRRACYERDMNDLASTMPDLRRLESKSEQEDTCMRPTTAPEATSNRHGVASTWSAGDGLSPRPKTAPERPLLKDAVEPKYLSTALVPRIPRRPLTSRRPCRLMPMRPRPAAELQLPTPSVQIVEAPTSCMVITPEGVEVQVPGHTWLVLASNDAEDSSTTRLSDLAGGGEIPEGTRRLLRSVPQDRLHAAAAEANFQRASRGTSLVALRHAACALELLGQRDREESTLPLILTSPSTSFASLPSEGSTQIARYSRMAKVVEAQASAAERRALLPKKPTWMARQEEDSAQMRRGRMHYKKGLEALNDFLEFARRRFGNPVRTWFKLDPEENMKLGEKLFVRRCLDLGFSGNVLALWRYVDSDRSGTVSILELSSHCALVLARFKTFIQETFNGSVAEVFDILDDNRSGRVLKAEFVAKLKSLSYNGSASMLFDLLDRSGLGFVAMRDLVYLETWDPPMYLRQEPDFELLDRFKDALVNVYGDPLFRSWQKLLDRDGTMRVSWEKFCYACRHLRVGNIKLGVEGVPETEEDVAKVWRALDKDCSGWISLREFDPESYDLIAEFKRWALAHHGGIYEAFRYLDSCITVANNRLSISELRKACAGDQGFRGDAGRLFEVLNVNYSGHISEQEVKFLHEWDLSRDEWESSQALNHKPLLLCKALVVA
mmetsp:Transcript_107481/g.302478  ORF Transcript_107481/g.302478 Transcript_107481/m.302478 type:complete len:713 (-) Transcript_107481:69-2207(-)